MFLNSSVANIIFIILIALLLACNNAPKIDLKAIESEIIALKTKEQKTDFLENIFFSFQELLNHEDDLIKREGFESPGHKSFIKIKKEKEEVFLAQMTAYFENYGYPSRTELGQYSSIMPILLVYYSTDLQGYRKDQFKYFYGAYALNDVPAQYFLAYLREFYKIEKGEFFVNEGSAKTNEEEIFAIMNALGYEH